MIALRVAAAVLWLSGFGFGVVIPYALREIAAHRPLPVVLGFRAFGGGPFEGSAAMVPLLCAFLVVCALEGLAGALVWNGWQSGAILSVALIPVAAFFWWGFDLPFAPIGAVVWVVLIVAGWRSLR